MPFARLALLAFLLCLFGANAPAQTYEGKELVQAELMANTDAVVAGKPFLVGLHLKMAPGWHTYWKFPGDAGIPTEIKWKLPAGWKAGEIRWPIPLKLSEPGDIDIYGYHDEVLLMQELTPPAQAAAAGSISLAAEASWLVCEKICIPGGKALQLDLPVKSSSTASNQEIFDRFQRSLPNEWPAGAARLSWLREVKSLRLTVASQVLAAYPAIEFFPNPTADVVVGHPAVESKTAGQVVFRIPIETNNAQVSALDGLVVFGPDNTGTARNAWAIPRGDLAATPTAPTAAPQSSSAGTIAKFLLFGLLGGFILNLMPCVLPVISLKIFGFIKQAGDSRRKILRNGLAFCAGIFAWFVALALVLIALKSAGRQITWAFQFTNPYFVLAMSAVVLVFALNLFGVFEIALPQTATRGVLGLADRGGEAGSFFQGMFATILATPCTAPFLGTALGFAFTQSSALILLMFVAIALGMSLPYLVLSAQPGWLRLVPKPGPWMLRVKQFMGFLLLATLLFLLSVLAAERGSEAVIWTGAFLLALSIACWVKGAWITPIASAGSRTLAWLAIVVIVASSGAWFIGGKFRETNSPAAVAASAPGDWQPFTPQRLQSELAAGKSVFVDFTAAWCITCKFNEATVLESAAVRAAFQDRGIVRLRADWTNGDPVITKILQQFGRPGVPFYVLYPRGNSAPAIPFPELLTQRIVLDKLAALGPEMAAK